ncbi:tyrosine-type recombinase/integrase [Brachybacterium tyrofermentans]|uniref:tyrosine-type recombinase/integrase n=1 Tax=Brachybacterium tyrofermentans TaxID=47848 RepID=UPI003FD20220
MASIQKRPDGRWRARYRDSARKEHARHFKRKIDAQQWLDDVTTAVGSGSYVDPVRAKTTVATVAETWMESPSWAESTRARNRSILDAHVLPRWGTMPLSDVHHEDVQSWVTGLGKAGMAGGTVRKVYGVLNGVLKAAIRGKRLAVNPAAEVMLPRQDMKRRRYLTGVQVEALAAAAGDRAVIVHVLAFCGLRIGELSALKAGAVDQVRRRLRIEESVTEVNGKLVWSEPKDHQRRTVPWPRFLDGEIEAAMKAKGPEDLLFPAPGGGALRVRNMRRGWFDAAAETAGMKGLTPHELRHTAASLAVSAGASVLALQRMLGHDKPLITLDFYSDLFDEDLDLVADRLGEARKKSAADYLRTVEANESNASTVNPT